VPDSAVQDSGTTTDSSRLDSSTQADSSSVGDSGKTDSSVVGDSAAVDSEVVDSGNGTVDSGVQDSGKPDTGSSIPGKDAAVSDSSHADSAIHDSGAVDSGQDSSALQDSGVADSASDAAPSKKAIIIDHTCTDIAKVPHQWIEKAQESVAWIYGHTSHGSQLITGANYLMNNSPNYRVATAWRIPPAQTNPISMRVGDDGSWSYNASSFLSTARSQLNDSKVQTLSRPVFMWSWCGQLSASTGAGDVDAYLTMMQKLESEYPSVQFVYMTGHTDAYNMPNVNANNKKIRDYVVANNRVLYDFADIESWTPGGAQVSAPGDDCPWCTTWCSQHPSECQNLPTDCAHSHGFNCKIKGQAFWWLSARIAGWSGQQ